MRDSVYSNLIRIASIAPKNHKCLLLLDLGFAAARCGRKPIVYIDLRNSYSFSSMKVFRLFDTSLSFASGEMSAVN